MNLNQVTVPVADVRRSAEFYTRLGLRRVVEAAGYARFECPDGDGTFSVEEVDGASPCGATVYFECERLDAVVADLKRRGFRFREELENKPWLWREARLEDPDGNRICLYWAGQNRKNPPWRKGGPMSRS